MYIVFLFRLEINSKSERIYICLFVFTRNVFYSCIYVYMFVLTRINYFYLNLCQIFTSICENITCKCILQLVSVSVVYLNMWEYYL